MVSEVCLAYGMSNSEDVLILVVVEDGLGDRGQDRGQVCKTVLILVVVEDGLGD